MLRSFELCEPTSVAEASVLLARHGDTARIYAGGTELILAMKEGLIHYDHLVNVKTIPGLAGVRLDGGALRIGAATPHRVLERDPIVRERFPAVARMETDVANVRVREGVTLGDGRVADARIAVGSVGPVPRRMREAEARLKDKAIAESVAALPEAARIAARAAEAITDLHGSAEYKEHLVGVLLRRAWEQALATVDGRAGR